MRVVQTEEEEVKDHANTDLANTDLANTDLASIVPVNEKIEYTQLQPNRIPNIRLRCSLLFRSCSQQTRPTATDQIF